MQTPTASNFCAADMGLRMTIRSRIGEDDNVDTPASSGIALTFCMPIREGRNQSTMSIFVTFEPVPACYGGT
jgi:hypothetical protein